MSIATSKPVTLEEFLRLEAEAPQGVSLELIAGEIVERPMTTRSPLHSHVQTRIAYFILSWFESQDDLAGSVNSGEVRCRLQRDPDIVVGIDVGVWVGTQFVEPPTNPPIFDSPPSIAIEVLSPCDTHEDVTEKLFLYLSSGVRQIWIVDPDVEIITIHRPNDDPQFFSSRQTLTAEPELPGFAVPVSQIFHSKLSPRFRRQ